MIPSTIAAALTFLGLLLGQPPVQRVAVVTEGAEVRAGMEIVARIARGQIFVVRGTRGQWWNVGPDEPRWVRKQDALPLDRAIEHFNESLRRNPRDAGAYHARGAVRSALGDYRRALADFDAAIRLDPDAVGARADRGSARFRTGDFDGAIGDFNEAVRIDPTYESAYANRAAAWTAKGEYEKAIVDYTEAIRLDPKLATAYRNRSIVWKLLGEYDKALTDSAACLELAPGDAQTLNNQAWIWATCPQPELRRGGAAIESASRACELTGWKRAGYLETLAAAYAEAGQFGRAVEAQRRAIELTSPTERSKLRERLELYRAEKPYHEHEAPPERDGVAPQN